MLQQSNPFGLLVPVRKVPTDPGLGLRAKEVSAWLHGLPLANPDILGKTLYRRIAVENRTEHKPKDRLQFIEQLREQVLYCVDHFKSSLVKSSLPMSSRKLKNATQARALLTELTNAYKIAVVDLLQETRIDDKAVALASQRAIHSLTRLLMVNYAHYTPAPQHIWMELHRLYHLAESREQLNLRIRDEMQPSRRSSVELEYKRILLLSLANPYRLRRDDIAPVYNALQEWAQQVKIERNPQFADNRPCFVIDLDSDQAPNQIQQNRVTDQVYNRYINLDRLNKLLRKNLDSVKKKNKISGSLSHNTLYKLLMTWDISSKRVFSRTSKLGKLDITVGINNTHDEIDHDIVESSLLETAVLTPATTDTGKHEQLPPPLELIDIQTGFTVEKVQPTEKQLDDPWDKQLLYKQDTHNDEQNHKPAGHKTTERFGPAKQTWRMLNISAGGYCIMWDKDTPCPTQVGEIVGIQETSPGGKQIWSIGIVRWMEYRPSNGLKMGIQLIAPNAMAVTTYPYGLKQPDVEKTLQLPDLPVIDQPASLVTSTSHYEVGDRLIVDHHGHTTVVQLSEVLEQTGNITRFQYHELNNKAVTGNLPRTDTGDTQEIRLSDFPDDYWNWPES